MKLTPKILREILLHTGFLYDDDGILTIGYNEYATFDEEDFQEWVTIWNNKEEDIGATDTSSNT